jgi:hypothetical protein
MRIIRAAALSLWALVSCGATAAEPDALTQWLCVDNGETALRCRVHRISAPFSAPAAVATLADRLPPIVRELRERPLAWRDRPVMIPMFNQPFDTSHVRQLAQAVLCGPRSDCVARVAAPGATEPNDWLAFADAHDPLLDPLDPDQDPR